MARNQHDIQVDTERDGQNRVYSIYCHICKVTETILDSEDAMLGWVADHEASDPYADEDTGEEE